MYNADLENAAPGTDVCGSLSPRGCDSAYYLRELNFFVGEGYMWRRLGMALAAGVLLGFGGIGAASAADMAVKARPMAAPVAAVYDWSGIYIGGAVGGAWNTTDGSFYNFPPGAFPWHTASHGDWIYGGFAGIQKQWGNFVLGVEGGWNGLGNSFGSTVAGGLGAPCGFVAVIQSCQSRITDIGYVGARVGYAWDRWMLYGQGGYARGNIETQGIVNATGLVFSPASANHDGWYAGAGFDYAVLDYLILGIDYKHYEFDAAHHDSLIVGDRRDVSAKADAVMGRVSFKFNPWPAGPVVARY